MGKLLANLTRTQIATILLVLAATGAGLYYFVRWRHENDFRPLYSELAAEDAGAIVERLKQSAVEYRLSADGRTVLAPSARVAELRLSLAGEGLPRNGKIGFELFDRTNFGATEFAEQINYRRALEGELARSVASLAAVAEARVHVTFPKDSVFEEARQPAKASVMVKLRPGAHLTQQNVQAISQLVASAVEGLAPQAVAVLDMQGNLLGRPRRAELEGGDPPSEAMLEFRQAIERDLAAKVATTLEPLLGPERFRTSAAVECDFSSGEQSEENFDPSRSVMLTSQKTEESTSAVASAGVPGTASNLPSSTSQAVITPGGVRRQTESITYQSSRTVRRVRIPQGAVKRISLAVLVDYERKSTPQGATVEPPSPEKLKTIRALVTAAAGLNPERGDQLILESLPFESAPAPEAGTPAAPQPAAPQALPPWLEQLRKQGPLVWGIAGGAALLLIVMFFLFRKIGRRAKVEVSGPAELPAATESEMPAAQPAKIETAAARTSLPPVTPRKTEVLATQIKEAVRSDSKSSVHVLRTWLDEEAD